MMLRNIWAKIRFSILRVLYCVSNLSVSELTCLLALWRFACSIIL